MSNAAARKLADEMCGERDIPLLVLHDFRQVWAQHPRHATTRYVTLYVLNKVEVIDLGLRLEDVNRFHLQAEDVFDKGSEFTRRINLRQNRATS